MEDKNNITQKEKPKKKVSKRESNKEYYNRVRKTAKKKERCEVYGIEYVEDLDRIVKIEEGPFCIEM
jgi:hypothetical protein